MSRSLRASASPLIFHVSRCDLFHKAYNHISERIDQVYKDLTKGKMAPTGGVAYLTLEDSEVCLCSAKVSQHELSSFVGTIYGWYQVPRHASHEALPRHGTTVRWGKDNSGTRAVVRYSQACVFFTSTPVCRNSSVSIATNRHRSLY